MRHDDSGANTPNDAANRLNVVAGARSVTAQRHRVAACTPEHTHQCDVALIIGPPRLRPSTDFRDFAVQSIPYVAQITPMEPIADSGDGLPRHFVWPVPTSR